MIVNAQDQKYRAVINILLTLNSPNRVSPVLLPIIMDNTEMETNERIWDASSSGSGEFMRCRTAASVVA